MTFEEVGEEERAEEVDSVDGRKAVGSKLLARQGGADACIVKEVGDGEVKRRPRSSESLDGG